jgi:serine/threonine-protein kinase SRPK3
LTLGQLRKLADGELPLQILKPAINYLLLALDFLHTEGNVVHAGKSCYTSMEWMKCQRLTRSLDIQEGNIMLSITDNSILDEFAEEEFTQPSPRKINGDHVIYLSRQLDIPDEPGPPVLCDFGDSHFGKEAYIGEVMPDLYRAQEIILGVPWNEKIDIWSVGLMVSPS